VRSGGVPASEPAPSPVAAEDAARIVPVELYLLRHADAGDPMAWAGDDAERPLSKKGRRQAKRVARLLRDLGFHPDVVITSTRVRAVQTARPVAKATGVDMLTDERLSGGFGGAELGELLRQLGAGISRVVLVGHDPDFSGLASFLVGARVAVAKGALVRIDLEDRRVGAGAGSLRWLLPPDAVAR
jgi:phosphohistidine phosphatase